MKIKITLFVLIITIISLCVIMGFSVPVKVVDKLVNYPNPFNTRIENTTIYYCLESDAYVRMEMYDLLGYKVFERNFSAGENGGKSGLNRIIWDGKNDAGNAVAKGGYICRVYAEYRDSCAYATHKIGVIH